MKKILLVVLSLFMMSTVSFSKNVSEIPSLYWVTSNNTLSIYVDKNGMEYNPANDTAKCYVTVNFLNEDRYCVGEYIINFKNNTLTTRDWIEYKISSDVHYNMNEPERTEKVRPSTNGEKIKNVVASLINRDEKLAEYQKEQKDKQKKDKVKKVADSVLGGLGGLF